MNHLGILFYADLLESKVTKIPEMDLEGVDVALIVKFMID